MKPRFLGADIDALIRKAEKLTKECSLCEHRCRINRFKEKGVCGVSDARISSHFFHYGEEKQIIPSFTIFFSGCNFECVYCQNWDISQDPENGELMKPEKMAKTIDRAFRKGAKNVNFVGGEPTPNLLFILKTLKNMKEPVPVIWNSNFYMTPECIEILNKVVDIYLSDFKYGNNECAKRLSNAEDYFDIVSRNHKIVDAELIIRHLVLPNHLECCTYPVLDWISENLEHNYCVNIMDQYRPMYRADEHEKINRPLKKQEFQKAVNHAKKLQINQC